MSSALPTSAFGMPAFVFGETVVLHTRTLSGHDALNVPTYNDADVTIPGATVYPTGSTEALQGGDTVTTGLTVLLPGWPILDATAQVTVRGKRWAVQGTPSQYGNPMTGDRVTEVRLQEVTG